jgi:hypothetical protein
MSGSSITLRFTHNDNDWRVMCHAASGRCLIWRNGSFLRSTTYVPKQGLKDQDGVLGEVVPALLGHLLPHDATIASMQRLRS